VPALDLVLYLGAAAGIALAADIDHLVHIAGLFLFGQRRQAAGARPQRLLWASTGTKDLAAPDTFYIEALAAPQTINTIPENTLLAFADHGSVGAVLPADGGGAEQVLDQFRREGVDVEALAARLQREGVWGFAESWNGLMARIREKRSPSASTSEEAPET
jgi:transaldolase